VNRLPAQLSECDATPVGPEIDTQHLSAADAVTFLEDAVDILLRLIWLYRETLYGEVPIPLDERRRMMREAEQQAGLEQVCDGIPAAFATAIEEVSRARAAP
jgi:hypothetical protein